MPALPKARYETVAQALAVGKTQREAYQAGGYRYKPANAHRLCTDPIVIARVNEIVSERHADERKARAIATQKAGLEESWIIERVKYVTEIALRGIPIRGPKGELTYGQPNLNAAVRALRLCCNIKGMLVHRHEVGDPGEFSRMTDDELDLSLEQQARALGLSDRVVNEILGLRCVKTKH
jgi:hypothetical protein